MWRKGQRRVNTSTIIDLQSGVTPGSVSHSTSFYVHEHTNTFAHTHYKYYQSQQCCTSIHGMTNRVLKIQTKPLRRESIYRYLLVQCSGLRPCSMAAFSAGRPKASQPIGFRTFRKKQAHIRQNQANSDSSKFFCPLWLWSKAVSVLVLEERICPQAESS